MSPSSTSTQRYLTIQEAADLLQFSDTTVRRLIARGTIKAYRFPGSRLIRIDPRDLDRVRKPVIRIADLGGDAA
ncbi:MAG: helix-turn-helix domain-containing protein [Actinomyces sp.]|jgi:excisionase family DNA binding protein|nr:helix-turn-helix domain-containing protein [Actinomyces sp.]MCI1788437.1 helix-turn-helix domain-containing protein [Actinomyces sp.]